MKRNSDITDQSLDSNFVGIKKGGIRSVILRRPVERDNKHMSRTWTEVKKIKDRDGRFW